MNDDGTSKWTTDTLKEYVTSLLETIHRRIDDVKEGSVTAMVAAEKAVNVAMTSSEKAVAKAEAASEKRFESVNEFRKTLSDQTASFVTRNEYGVAHTSITEKIGALTMRVAAYEGRGLGFQSSWAVFVAAVSIIIAIAALYFRH